MTKDAIEPNAKASLSLVLANCKDKEGFSLTASIFGQAIGPVRYAAATDASRYYLCGVFLDGSDEGLNLVTTDGHRAERRLIPTIAFDDQESLASLPKVIIGAAAVDRIIKLADAGEDIRIEVSANKVRAIVDDVVLIAKLIDGQYPDWPRIIPKSNDLSVRFAKAQMISAIGRVLLATPDAGNGVALRVADGFASLETHDMASGVGEDAIEVEAAEPIAIGLHGKQLTDALEHMQGDTVEVMLKDSQTAAILRQPGDEINMAVLMPMRTVKGVQI